MAALTTSAWPLSCRDAFADRDNALDRGVASRSVKAAFFFPLGRDNLGCLELYGSVPPAGRPGTLTGKQESQDFPVAILSKTAATASPRSRDRPDFESIGRSFPYRSWPIFKPAEASQEGVILCGNVWV